MTYRDEIIKNWIASGADPQLIRLNPGAVEREAQRELRAWIDNFIASFKASSRLTKVLESALFLRCRGFFWNEHGRSIGGLVVAIRPTNNQNCQFLLSKRKQLSYRIRQLDKEAKLLSICNIEGTKAITTVLQTGEIILTSVPPVETKGGLR
jgi:hypothetical protein